MGVSMSQTDATINVSGNTLIITITGIPNTTVDWFEISSATFVS